MMTTRKTSGDGDSNLLVEDQQDGGSLDSQEWYSSHGPEEEDDKMNYFTDGKTQIDFVLVWETWRDLSCEQPYRKRQKYFECLEKFGLDMEEHSFQEKGDTLHFMLLSAPWPVLCYFAEEMGMRVPLQTSPAQFSPWLSQVLNKFSIPNMLQENVPKQPPETFTCPFKNSKLSRYPGSENHATFFTNTQRHQILYEILACAPYGNSRRGEVGMERLLCEKVLSAAYPLHDGTYAHTPGTPSEQLFLRQILFQYWARWSKWNKYQPLDHIRKYYGEKIALYFAWLGVYTGWLLPASLVGMFVFIMGFIVMINDIPTTEVCNSKGLYIMCPVCKICPNWNLSSVCAHYRAGVLVDQPGTLFFSIFMSIWAVTFLEYWKRFNAKLTYRWDCFQLHEIEEHPRPEFTVLAPLTIQNPITGIEEPYFPESRRLRRMLTGSMAILLMIAVVFMFLISIILYRVIICLLVAKSGNESLVSSARRIASITGSVVNLCCILVLSKVYISLALLLTRWEMHRTQTAYEDALTFKVFLFQFVNYYSTPIYIAFFKGRFVGYPGHYNTLFRIRNEDCDPGGCLIELAQEMLVIMVGKQILNNITEFVIPKVQLWWLNRRLSKVKTEENPWERDYKLIRCNGLFDEYLEMVIQFGFITIFVAACPLAPFFALLNNWIEVRLDAQKFVCEYRRPVAERARGIGIWMSILEVITCIAVVSNAFLVAFTSDFLPRTYYQYFVNGDLTGYINFTLAKSPAHYTENHTLCRYRAFRDSDGNLTLDYWNLMAIRLAFVIVFEHVVFLLARMIDFMVPDIPESVEIKVKRENFLAKQALAENESLAHFLGLNTSLVLRSRHDPSMGFASMQNFTGEQHTM